MPGITDPTDPYFKDGQWGWDGTVWRKLPLLWGYSDRWVEAVDATSPNGTTVAQTAQVAEGYVHVLQLAVAWHDDPAASRRVRIQATDGTTHVECADETVAADIYVYSTSMPVVLKKDDRVRGVGGSLATGTKAYLKCWGYKMKIAE